MSMQHRNIGSLIAVMRAAANTAVTAGGGGDATEVTGVIIDRAALGWPESAVLAIPYSAVLAAAETLTLAYSVKEGNASNLSDAAVLQSAAAAVVATGAGTITGCFEVSIPLRGAGRYVRADWTPNLSRAGTDTAALSAVMAFGGANRLPA